MHYNIAALTAFVAGASAFPAISNLESRANVRKNEPNSGFFPNHGFNEKDQFVDVRPGSVNAFVAPRSSDIRGPCPGLNAAANHQFIDHSGVIDFTDTTRGLQHAFSFGFDFSAPLFFFATFNSGSFIDEKWSIGGPMKGALGTLLGGGKGISNSHNKYEGDSSPGRGDAFLHAGDAHSLNIPNFSNLWFNPGADGTYDFISLRRQANAAHEFTINNNPYAFFGPVFFVSPIAHQFIGAMMSNHSAENVQGVLTKEVLGSIFSVKEMANGDLEWIPGMEAIPQNWYKRPSSNPYDITASFGDFAITCAQTPQICDVGGNQGKPGTFVGLEFEDLTGGVFNGKDLLKGNNLACLALEGATFVNPGLASKLEAATSGFLKKAQTLLGATKSKLGCPQLTQYDISKFNQFPGFTLAQPEQPATPY